MRYGVTPSARRQQRRTSALLLAAGIVALAALPARAQSAVAVRLVAGADTELVTLADPTVFIADGDIVVFVAANDLMHSCDTSEAAGRLRVTLGAPNPTTGATTAEAAIAAVDGPPVALPIQIAAPLSPRRSLFTLGVLPARSNTVLCSTSGELVKPVALTVAPTEGGELVVSTPLQRVNDGDVARWTITNEAAHLCDVGLRVGAKARLSVDDPSLLPNADVVEADLPALGGGDAVLTTRIADPLAAGSYSYRIDILNQHGRLMCNAVGTFEKPGSTSHRRPTRHPRPPRPPRP